MAESLSGEMLAGRTLQPASDSASANWVQFSTGAQVSFVPCSKCTGGSALPHFCPCTAAGGSHILLVWRPRLGAAQQRICWLAAPVTAASRPGLQGTHQARWCRCQSFCSAVLHACLCFAHLDAVRRRDQLQLRLAIHRHDALEQVAIQAPLVKVICQTVAVVHP